MGIDKVGYEGITREEYYRKQESGDDSDKTKVYQRRGLGPTTKRGSQ
jgi:hypothetical protein